MEIVSNSWGYSEEKMGRMQLELHIKIKHPHTETETIWINNKDRTASGSVEETQAKLMKAEVSPLGFSAACWSVSLCFKTVNLCSCLIITTKI